MGRILSVGKTDFPHNWVNRNHRIVFPNTRKCYMAASNVDSWCLFLALCKLVLFANVGNYSSNNNKSFCCHKNRYHCLSSTNMMELIFGFYRKSQSCPSVPLKLICTCTKLTIINKMCQILKGKYLHTKIFEQFNFMFI